eukprot:COSAG01_NODE_32939_length_573_cov_0.518987_1_plen_94_part_10
MLEQLITSNWFFDDFVLYLTREVSRGHIVSFASLLSRFRLLQKQSRNRGRAGTDNGAQAERWTSNRGGSGPHGDTSGAFSNAVGTQGPFRGCKA